MNPLPHGGKLINKRLRADAIKALKGQAPGLPSLILDPVNLADLEMLASGAYSPLTGFMGAEDYTRVLAEMRLAKGVIWPIPITLAAAQTEAISLEPGREAVLRDQHGSIRGLIKVSEVFPWSPEREARAVFDTVSPAHPGVDRLLKLPPLLVAGEIWALPFRAPGPWRPYCLEPAETRAEFARRGWRTVTGFQTRNPIHRAHEYLQKTALEVTDGLLMHPLIGITKKDDISAEVRLKCYQAVLAGYFPAERAFLSAMPGPMRYAGPREAVLHALVRKNYGCTHFIVGRGHAGVGDFYRPYAAQEIFSYFSQGELGLQLFFFDNAFYCRICQGMATAKTCPHGMSEHVNLSGTAVRVMLAGGEALPPEFTRPEVAKVLLDAERSRGR
jgi:sulfate adenylyltransferase